MARKAVAEAVPLPTPYDLMAQRIKRIILSPRCQIERRALISRLPEEPQEDWEALLDQIDEEESVTLVRQDDGSVRVCWTIPKAD